MHLQDLIEFFQNMAWVIGFGVTVREISREEMPKTAESAKQYQNLIFSKVDILLTLVQNPVIHSIF